VLSEAEPSTAARVLALATLQLQWLNYTAAAAATACDAAMLQPRGHCRCS
jgi:hypothetical protein